MICCIHGVSPACGACRATLVELVAATSGRKPTPARSTLDGLSPIDLMRRHASSQARRERQQEEANRFYDDRSERIEREAAGGDRFWSRRAA